MEIGDWNRSFLAEVCHLSRPVASEDKGGPFPDSVLLRRPQDKEGKGDYWETSLCLAFAQDSARKTLGIGSCSAGADDRDSGNPGRIDCFYDCLPCYTIVD